MTVKELRDALGKYISKDPPDTWQLNDVEADAAAYKERCRERENREVVVLDGCMQQKSLSSIYPIGNHGKLGYKEVFALCINSTKNQPE